VRRTASCAIALAIRCAPSLLFAAVFFIPLFLAADRHPARHLAYIGPGAGFAFLESLLTLVISFFASLFAILLWPVRMLLQTLRRGRRSSKAHVGKLIFLGLDGLDPAVTEKLLAEGKLPNLARLRDSGSYRRLRTTYPALSPVAWSTFATGVNPGKHNIFDFLNRDLRSYAPELSSAKVRPPDRVLHIGKWRIPLSRASVEMRRKSQPFWKILGSHAVGCTILRVPITFPPEPFDGRLLSAMCTPDLRGTQGTFTLFTTAQGANRLRPASNGFEGSLEGPENDLIEGSGPLRIPFRLVRRSGGWTLEIQGDSYSLDPGEYTPWVRLSFRTGRGVAVSGIARFLLTRPEPDLSLYVTPIQIDPVHPALPISRPQYYAAYLAKLLGSFATLGMAEDTWALNEGAIDHEAFLKQAVSIQKEREAMFFSALEHTRRGVVACVFDTTDRVQHMFFRNREVIERLYCDMDRLVGKTLEFVDSNTALFVLSDHGFCSFDRGVNLNAWLQQNGYLALQDGASASGEYFSSVDWSRTAAYTLGLGGVYLNLRGRESHGAVAPEEAEQLKRELIAALAGLRDPERNAVAIRNVYASSDIYQGPYLGAAPDLIIGYADGYRASWEAASGCVTASVFEDNTKPWCGDHCVDPALVPGVLFSNRKMDAEDPGIEDMAPTALRLFGIEPPPWMEGESVIRFA
jgi:predicted AlkP superfamily phosphohydrolase/phosphomutase